MSNKITNRKALAIAISIMENLRTNSETSTFTIDKVEYPVADVVAKLKAISTAFENKASNTTRKPTAIQIESAKLRENIMAYLYENPALIATCTDIGKMVPTLAGLNNQKISALMRKLEEEGRVVKIVDKRKTFYKLAKEDGE